MTRLELYQFNELKRQLDLVRESADAVGGNLENQIAGMALIMAEVARILKLPADQTIRQLPAWAIKVMERRE